MPEQRIVAWLAIAGCVILADQATKLAIEHALALGTSIYVWPVFDLVHVRNTGAAFSFLAGGSGWQREFFLLVGLAASIWIVWMLARAARSQVMFCVALSLVLGGALGNVIDRVRLGAVVDFLHFHWGPHSFPAFNIADSAITCGAALLLFDAFRQGRKARTDGSHAATQ
ncbi:MAG: lipoprotein signal peptidase [Betaproteobacteria bacterium]|nr:lipoprotein signal peptidase [Betaproteobacteria bacterium]